MRKSEFVSRVAEEAGITKKSASDAVNALIGAIYDSLTKEDGKIHIADLGTFRVVEKKARTGINPQTKVKINIPAAKVARFSPSRALRDGVRKAL